MSIFTKIRNLPAIESISNLFSALSNRKRGLSGINTSNNCTIAGTSAMPNRNGHLLSVPSKLSRPNIWELSKPIVTPNWCIAPSGFDNDKVLTI